MTQKEKEQLLEAVKEFIRTMILALIVATASAIGIILFGIDTKVGAFNISWKLVMAVFVFEFLSPLKVALLKSADKWLHVNEVKTPLDLEGMDKLIEK